MNQQKQSNEATRQKRVDELFAEEPHLSPTMKARRLHEKIEAEQAKNAGWMPIVPPLPKAVAGTETQTISLKRAAGVLQARTNGTLPPDDAAMRLFRFRDGALAAWLEGVPELRREPQADDRKKQI